MLNEWQKVMIREQAEMNHGLDEGLKEEMAQSFGCTVRQIEEFARSEGIE